MICVKKAISQHPLQMLSDVSEFSEGILSWIDDLEGAFERDALDVIVGGLTEPYPGAQPLVDYYAWLSTLGTSSSSLERSSWIASAVARFRTALRKPNTLWTCCVIDAVLVARDDRGKETTRVRADQVSQCRYWGHWFSFDEEGQKLHTTARLARVALRRLVSDFAGIKELQLLQATRKTGLPWLSGDSGRLGFCFEQLVLDILNEDYERASLATFTDDLLAKTDLRVSYPETQATPGGTCPGLAALRFEETRQKVFGYPAA